MVITLYDKAGIKRATIAPNDSSSQQEQIQGDNILSLSFTHYEWIGLEVNDYVDFLGKRYYLMEQYKPKEKNESEWVYDIKLYGIESLIKRFLVIETTDNNAEPVFTLTAPAAQHVKMIVRCINDGMKSEDWKVGQVDGTDNIVIDYEGKYCDEALKELAEKVGKGAEWWVEGQTINVTRCEWGEPITLQYGKGLTALERDAGNTHKFYTRLFPIGSSRNIDTEKYGAPRLMLPSKKKYVELHVEEYGVFDHFERQAFAEIYPRRIGDVSSVRYEDRTGDNGKPFRVYFFKDEAIPFDPNQYKLLNEVMRVSFQSGELVGLGDTNDHYFEVNYNSDTKEFEIITIYPYNDNTQLPWGKLVPNIGDKYIIWNLTMPDEYYRLAEQEFQEAVDKFNEEHWWDIAVYKAPVDPVWVEEHITEPLTIGQRVKLVSDIFFPEVGFRNSRITKVTRKVAQPSQMDLEISDALQSTAMSRVNDAIGEARAYTKEVERGSVLPDIIRSSDNTLPTDNNLLSARKTMQEFLSKKHPSSAQAFIKFLAGIGIGSDAKIDREGNALLRSIQLLGTEPLLNGFNVYMDSNGRAHGQIDFLHVLGKAIFNTVVIRELSHVGGDIGLSKASGKIIKVVKVEKGWKCYLKTDDGTIFTFNGWKGGDQAKCQTFNLRKGITNNAANRYYWRCVEEVAEKTDTEEAYIVLSNIEHFFDPMGTDEPREGDTIVLCGHNRTWDLTHGITESDTSRMNFTQITTSKEEGGTIEVYRNIQDFKMTLGNAIFYLSSEKIYMNSRHFEWVSSDGERIPNVLYRGDWVPGTVAAKYEAWYYTGGTWLSLVDNNTDEPMGQSKNWKQYAAKGEDGTSPYTVRVQSESGGNVIHNGQGEIVLVAAVFHGEEDITSTLQPYNFSWVIQTGNTDFDKAWNARHEAVGNSITVRAEEVSLKAQIDCMVEIER